MAFTLNHKNDDISVLVCIYVLKQVGWKNRINISTAVEVNQRTIGLQMHAYSGNVPYKENIRVESLNVDSSSIKIEVARNGRTHMNGLRSDLSVPNFPGGACP